MNGTVGPYNLIISNETDMRGDDKDDDDSNSSSDPADLNRHFLELKIAKHGSR